MKDESRLSLYLGFYFFVLVGGIIIEHYMHLHLIRNIAFKLIENAKELLMSEPFLAGDLNFALLRILLAPETRVNFSKRTLASLPISIRFAERSRDIILLVLFQELDGKKNK